MRAIRRINRAHDLGLIALWQVYSHASSGAALSAASPASTTTSTRMLVSLCGSSPCQQSLNHNVSSVGPAVPQPP